jgi:hypothetical protein
MAYTLKDNDGKDRVQYLGVREPGNELSSSMKLGEFLEKLNYSFSRKTPFVGIT